MEKGLILYASKYGATRNYAGWLAEATGFSISEVKAASRQQLAAYDTVILGGGVYASGIAGLSFLRKNRPALAGKRLFVFAVGASPYDETAFGQLIRHNFKNDFPGVPCFYCRGAWDEAAMSFGDRTLCRLLQKSLEKRDPETLAPWEAALMQAAGRRCDWTDPAYLTPLLAALGQ